MRLECSKINYSYDETSPPVLDQLDCAFTRPGFHAVFGSSGVGKSSFARLIASRGKLSHRGTLDFQGLNTVLYSFNLERLPGWASVGKHIEQVVSSDKTELKKQLVSIFNLAPLLTSRFHQLSMGQQNRVNLIRYLLQDFDLLILDESLANVDEQLRQVIILAIKKLFPEKMFIYISHNLMEVSTFCDEIIVFGTAGSKKRYFSVSGQNCRSLQGIDKTARDKTMLEIMNAF